MQQLKQQQDEQQRSLERLADGFDIDCLADVRTFPDGLRGLTAAEFSSGAALLTVPLSSTLAVQVEADGGALTVLGPPELPLNVKKAFEAVADLVRDTQDYQLAILAVLLLWVRKYGNEAWQEYCNALLPPVSELSCLLNYSPGELPVLQLPQLMDEAGRQHDWARWVHSQWTSSASGALRRLGLADNLEDTTWALANVRSRAIEFPIGLAAGAAPLGPGRAATTPQGPHRGPVIAVLAPLTDLANHSSDPNCVVQLTTDRSRVVLLPRRPVRAGEPLTVDYGYNRSALELMADYGFVTAGNPFDGEVALAGAEQLPPLDQQMLEAAARALQRQHDNLINEVERDKEEEAATEAEDAGARPQAVRLGSGAEACFSGRLRAAVALLSPRSPAGGRAFSTPATQRIVAGLHHKLVRHCADALPTTLEQDLQLLADIRAGRLSGMTAGMSMELDPEMPAVPPMRPGPAPPPPPPQQRQPAPEAQAREGAGAAGASGPASDAGGTRAGAAGVAPTLQHASGAEVLPTAPWSRAVALRPNRRAGRLYAALRARVEYKELLRVAEELLMEYGRR